MITNTELTAVKLSPTKKDYYQIWNELMDVAGKISERWDPASTNESDPGIILLKVLTAVADKLNYNIDANTLEAFMPSAAQEESMRKLTEMLGYDMKYYQSATTEVKITYNNNSEEPISGILSIDKFTNLKDIDDNINYVTLDALSLTSSIPFGNVNCMEGELVECETDDNNIVSMFHLDDNKRYFLPETQIAENGIFISNIENNIEGQEWKKVSNLNAQSLGSKVFKFGFDSQEGLPYIQFPEDISTIIEDGLRIKYIRTSGADGNISMSTLSKLTTPISWSSISSENKAAYHDVANYSVSNIRAATNGANKESINSAYNNFKRTVGTFDTLVTCRDYMNKIYQMISVTDNTTPLVSNIIVSDIKDDINRANTICTFTNRGIEYKVVAKPGKDLNNFDLMLYPFKSVYGLNSKSEFDNSFTYDESNVGEIISSLEDNKTISHNFKSPSATELACIKNYYKLRAKVNTIRKVGIIEQKSILNNIYKELFKNFNMRQLEFGEEIPYDLILKVMENADPRIKNISLDDPEITTKFMSADNVDHAVSDSDEAGKTYHNQLALNNVLAGRVPLFNYDTNFATSFKEKNYSDIVDKLGAYETSYINAENTGVTRFPGFLEEADGAEEEEKSYLLGVNQGTLGKTLYVTGNVANERYLETTEDKALAAKVYIEEVEGGSRFYILDGETKKYLDTYLNDANKISLRFDAASECVYAYDEATKAWVTNVDGTDYYFGISIKYDPIYPNDANSKQIYKIKTEVEIPVEAVEETNFLKLTENEVIQFRAPSFKTTTTYPAYVNYYLHLNKEGKNYVQAIPATMQSLRDFLRGGPNATNNISKETLEYYINNTNFPANLITELEISADIRNDEAKFKWQFDSIVSSNCAIFVKSGTTYQYVQDGAAGLAKIEQDKNTIFYTLLFDKSGVSGNGYIAWAKWLVGLQTVYLDHTDEEFNNTTLSNNRIELTTSDSNEEEAELSYKKINGFYRVVSNKLGTIGHLVDSFGSKYKLVEQGKDVADNPFDIYFVPRIWSDIKRIEDESQKATASAKDWHTLDSLGQNAVPFNLTKNIEYELDKDEYLLINYMQSKSDNSDQKEEIYKVYRQGHIIKPNFDLSDSEDWYKSNHSYTKHGVLFDGYSNVSSMFTLGTDQQIEIREIVKIVLDEKNTNLYWDIPDLVSTQGEYLEFPFNEEPISPTNGKSVTVTPSMVKGEDYIYSAYTLKEGEYLYYTDMNKSDIAFYGFGSTIRRTHKTPTIYKYVTENTITSEEIATNGLSESIPWRNYNFEDNGSLSIIENQFINLTEGDYLISIELENNEDCIDSEYKNVVSATYSFAMDANNSKVTEEKDLVSSSLPPLHVSDYKWQVHSKLNLAVGPNNYQTLRTKDIEGSVSGKKVKDKITLINTTNAGGVDIDEEFLTLEASGKDHPLSFKTNKIVQSATKITDVTKKEFSETGVLEKRTADLQIKLFEVNNVKSKKDKIINIGNYGSGQFTTVNFEEQASPTTTGNDESISFDLNLIVPTNTFGLMMIYYKKLDDKNTNKAKITWTKENNIAYYNNSETASEKELILNEGVNIIKIEASDVLTISSNLNNKAVVIFGSLDLINIDNPINPKLKYKAIDEKTVYDQILKDIKNIDENNEFYYNVPISSDLDIDMNPNDEKDNLENPLNWFNYNNINNKFVISVIDTEYLSDDIVIARSSRSNF